MSEYLIPCHCGWTPAKFTQIFDDEIRISYVCINKHCVPIKDHELEAIDQWNTKRRENLE